MKELEEPLLKLVIQAETKVKQELKYLGSARLIPGLILWQFDYKTGEVKRAEVDRRVIFDTYKNKPVKINKVTIQDNCLYRQATNIENAIKKFKKALNLKN